MLCDRVCVRRMVSGVVRGYVTLSSEYRLFFELRMRVMSVSV